MNVPNGIQNNKTFPEGFQFTLPDPSEDSLSMTAIALCRLFLK